MKVISVISQKGGAGKTTFATALAVESSRQGLKTVMFDLDPQATATFWKDVRVDDSLAITAIPYSRLPHVLKAVAGAGCDMVVIDTPPFAKEVAYEAARHADFVLIPTQPRMFDVQSMTSTYNLIKEFNRPHAVVLNRCPPVGKELDDAEDTIRKMGANLYPVRIGERIAFSRAQQNGQSAQEIEPHGKAAEEIRALWDFVSVNVNKFESKKVTHG